MELCSNRKHCAIDNKSDGVRSFRRSHLSQPYRFRFIPTFFLFFFCVSECAFPADNFFCICAFSSNYKSMVVSTNWLHQIKTKNSANCAIMDYELVCIIFMQLINHCCFFSCVLFCCCCYCSCFCFDYCNRFEQSKGLVRSCSFAVCSNLICVV